MTQLVNITHEAHELIRSRARANYEETGVRQPDGSWNVPFEQDTIDGVEYNMLNGETFSDTLIRIVRGKLS